MRIRRAKTVPTVRTLSKPRTGKPSQIFIEFSRLAPLPKKYTALRRVWVRLFGTYFFTVDNDTENALLEALEDAREIDNTRPIKTILQEVLSIAWHSTIPEKGFSVYFTIGLETGVKLIFKRKLVADSRLKDSQTLEALGFAELAENIALNKQPFI